jgi:hypothetical protein
MFQTYCQYCITQCFPCHSITTLPSYGEFGHQQSATHNTIKYESVSNHQRLPIRHFHSRFARKSDKFNKNSTAAKSPKAKLTFTKESCKELKERTKKVVCAAIQVVQDSTVVSKRNLSQLKRSNSLPTGTM